jgi:MFS superfamily sulfate permease-like transporter
MSRSSPSPLRQPIKQQQRQFATENAPLFSTSTTTPVSKVGKHLSIGSKYSATSSMLSSDQIKPNKLNSNNIPPATISEEQASSYGFDYIEQPESDSVESSSSYNLNYTIASHPTSINRNIPHIRSNELVNVPFIQKLGYYIPCYNWLAEYKLNNLLFDIIAGLTLASYQIPLSMSFATAVAHVPTASGLLGLSIGPMVYLLMGTVPQMIVGPEAAVSMIIGQRIEKIIKHNNEIDPVDILCNLTFLSGMVLLIFGILRFGFLDNVLCGTLLRGFITAIGLSMILNSIISMLGLNKVLSNLPSTIHVHSAVEKFQFLFNHFFEFNKITTIISFTSFFTLLFLSQTKKILVKRKFKSVSYFPEILFTIVIFTIFSYIFDFKNRGVEIVGYVSMDDFKFRNPLTIKNREMWGDLFPVSFVCAILGFFETSTAGKSLSSTLEMPVSSNRELVSLGIVGTTVSWFGALPAFGGYARSKLNAMVGAKTPVSGFVMGLTTLFVTFKLLNYIYYLPICVLNSVIAVVGYRMIQETPKELKFHFKTKGWNEIVTFIVTLVASLYYSIEIGVSMGCFYSLMRVLKHSTQSRVQILSRVAGTDTFVNPDCDDSSARNFFKLPKRLIVSGYKEFRRQSIADQNANLFSDLQNLQSNQSFLDRDKPAVELKNNDIFPQLEDREGCLIVKIAEPLTFFNANDMKGRLKRIELYGSTHEHPGSKQITNKELRHVVFDLQGMTSIDSSATQILFDIVENFQKRGINVFFTRIFKSGHLIQRLKDSGIERLLSLVDGNDFGIKQTIRPYYDDILDALKAIDKIDSTCDWETRSYFSNFEL